MNIKGGESRLNRKPHIQSLSEFKRGISKDLICTNDQVQHNVRSDTGLINTLSPLKNGNNSSVSISSRNNILNFAHPVDAAIIKTLDNPAINTIFNKIVQTGIDATWGLSLATGIHVGPNTYPELYKIVIECADKLGIPIPYVVISDQIKGINACTAGTNQFSFIAISSMLPLIMNIEELKFIIGHECGHLALGHVVYHTAINMVGSVSELLPDRAGLICCEDIEIAAKSLLKLEAGLLNIDEIDIDTYVNESNTVLQNTMLGKLGEITMSHPIIPKRIKALQLFSNSIVYIKALGIKSEASNSLLTEERLSAETEKIIEIM